MKKFAFTLMEVLLAMAIIGVLATAAANTLGNIGADKTKVAFKNCYNHMVQTVDSIVSDETKCPNLAYNASGTYTNSQGRNTKKPLRDACVILNDNGTFLQGLDIFPRHFLAATSYISSTPIESGQKFEAKNGSYWIVQYNLENGTLQNSGTIDNINKTDYIILFDVDGIGIGSDCPYKLSDGKVQTNEGANCSNPDTFKFGITYDNLILPDTQNFYNGSNLQTYMTNNHLIETEF